MTSSYQELPVSPALARQVVCTWIDACRDRQHAVLPDACIDLVWDGANVVVAGPDTRAWQVAVRSTFLGIRFQPGAAPGFLGVPASELVNQTLPLSEFWGVSQAEELAERLASAGGELAGARVLQDALLERQTRALAVDDLVEHVVQQLRRATGPAIVRTLADRVGLSERSLLRRCTNALGYGPKTLDRILRFQRALRLASATGNGLAEVALRAGYVDQAHLSNDVRRLAGTTPGELFRGSEVILSANGA